MLHACHTFSCFSQRRQDRRLQRVTNVEPAFVDLGFAAERTAKILAKEGTHLKKQPEFQRHLA